MYSIIRFLYFSSEDFYCASSEEGYISEITSYSSIPLLIKKLYLFTFSVT